MIEYIKRRIQRAKAMRHQVATMRRELPPKVVDTATGPRYTLNMNNKVTYRTLKAMLNCADFTEDQLDLPITGCAPNGDLLQATLVQTTNNGSEVIDQTTPVIMFEKVG
jgi:hypothetical protein